MTEPDPKPAKPRRLRLILALAGVVLVLVAALSWLNRRTLARDTLTGWFRSKGVASEAEVYAIGPTTFTARMRVGDPRHPDFAAERVEVRYRPRLTGIEIVSVTLRKPLLRASYRGGKLGVGALDPIVQDFLRRPPRPDAAKPRVTIDDGVLTLSTDYGPLRIAADAVVDDGRLQTLAATSAPARLKGPAFDVAMGAATLKTTTRVGRIDLTLAAPMTAATVGLASAKDGRLSVSAQFPYPDLAKRRGDGPLAANVRLTARRLEAGGHGIDGADLSLALAGRAQGWINDLAVGGQLTGDLKATAGGFGGARARAIRASVTAPDVRWTRAGGDRVSGTVRLNGGVEGLDAGALSLSALTVTAAGPVTAARTGVTADLRGSAIGRGAWSGFGAAGPADAAELLALKRAARGFRIAASGLTVRWNDSLTLGLDQPARLATDSGARVELGAVDGRPLVGPGAGGFQLSISGGGLPSVQAQAAGLILADGGASASGRIRAQGAYGFVQGGDLDASGRLRIADGAAVFTGDRCAALKVQRLEFGANDVEALSGRLCAPVLSVRGGDWRLTGRAEGVAASVPFLQSRIDGGAIRIAAASQRGRLTAQGQVTAARLHDTAPQGRFNPMALSGDATFASDIWKADLAARLPGGPAVGRAHLVHDAGLGVGFVTLDTDDLTFAPGTLQPVQLAPSAAALGSPVTGSAQFKGRFDWAREGAGSSGTLSIPALDFQSAAGPVEGLKGQIAFTSLAPLVAAPGQQLEIARVSAIVPLTGLKATFELAENLLKIAGGEAAVGGGRIRVESLEYPLTPDAPMRGVLFFEGVQLHDLLEASPFGDKVELDAKVSGRIAFEATGNRVRVTGGELKADQAGRISIDRAALTGVQAETAIATTAAVAPVDDPNATFTDFAYQAMENLAFDTLEATVASREDGRLGVLFHIVGRHDPPTRQAIKLTLMDLLQKRFLGRPLPLPSGTGVNLTLDTTLNLDDLLSDYAEYRRLHGSGPVQP